MRAKAWLGCVLAVFAAMAVARASNRSPAEEPSAPWVTTTAARDGLILRADVVQAHGAIAVETRLENRRSQPVELVPDQCGRVTEAVVRRTRFEPTGRRWSGSIAALKRLIVRDQLSSQAPEGFAPRVPGQSSRAVPPCEWPREHVRLAPGATIRERWVLAHSWTLDAVGSAGAVVQVSAVEGDRSDTRELLDLASEETARRRRARTIRTETPASAVISQAPNPRPGHMSPAQQFDALLADARLRAWIEAQPASSWRDANLFDGRLRAVSTRYERAATATRQRATGRIITWLPGPADRDRPFLSARASLPPGVRVTPDADNARPTRDVVPGRITLPTGRLVADGDGFYSEHAIVEPRVAPGAYPVHITLMRSRLGGREIPGLASLHVTDAKIARWRLVGGIGTDGATGGFTSAEGAAAYRRLRDDGERWWQDAVDSLAAHDWQATRILPLGKRTNAVQFSTGASDGGYQLWAGLDAHGRAVRFVVDFRLIRLAWPRHKR